MSEWLVRMRGGQTDLGALDSSGGGDGLWVKRMDVLASRQHRWIPAPDLGTHWVQLDSAPLWEYRDAASAAPSNRQLR